MNPLVLFAIELGLCLVSSTVVMAFLARPLRRLLLEVCGTVERAQFWVVYSGVMIFIAPLVMTVLFGRSDDPFTPTIRFYKAALGSALAGVFVALAIVGLQIARHLPAGDEKPGAPS